MGLIKEPKNVDFSIQSEPWTEKDLIDFRILMKQIKVENLNQKKMITIKSKQTALANT